MTRTGAIIWFWSLPILPFTTIITFVLTLVVCSQVLHNPRLRGDLPPISLLGVDSAYRYFVSGFVILALQFLLILTGRLQYLLQSQSIINRIHLYIIHGIAFISWIFLLIMAIVSTEDNPHLHFTGAFGMFGFLSLYCFLHTIAAFYLFIKRSETPEHSNILLPLWFLICSILLIIFFSGWVVTAETIPQYIAAGMPFLYFLGFVPQFWTQAKMKSRDTTLLSREYNLVEMRL